jgi:hypothetical protein
VVREIRYAVSATGPPALRPAAATRRYRRNSAISLTFSATALHAATAASGPTLVLAPAVPLVYPAATSHVREPYWECQEL